MVTVFVGPNNSGKSKVLREILATCSQGVSHVNGDILDHITFTPYGEEAAAAQLEAIRVTPRSDERVGPESAVVERGAWRAQVRISRYIDALTNPNAEDHRRAQFSDLHLRHFTVDLDGANRIILVNPKDRGDLKRPDNSFSRLLTDDLKRKSWRDTIHDAVGLYVGIDMSQGSNLSLRFGNTPPIGERTVEDDALLWMKQAQPVQEVSDGVKAFVGILTELRAGDPEILIIDEPEAFLHPSLAYKLGKEIAKTAAEGGKHVFAATHSPQFLIGAIQSGAKVDVIRLTYRDGVGRARLLANSDVAAMMRDPLLRSANALAGIFYENVVVTEADADRAFYQEINDRLLALGSNRGIPNALFLNGNGKDTVHRIVGPLRRLGIPAATVLDIDALKLGGSAWTAHLSSCGFPPAQFPTYQAERANIWALLEKTGMDPKRSGGISLLSKKDKEAAENLLQSLARYGLFIVPNGEVENWLPKISVTRTKGWLHEIFGALGSDPKDSAYVTPESDDVWQFVDGIADWAKGQEVRGIS